MTSVKGENRQTQEDFSPTPAHLRSQDLLEVVVILHVCGLLLPGMALVSQRHLLVVTVRNNTGEEQEGKAFLKTKTNKIRICPFAELT